VIERANSGRSGRVLNLCFHGIDEPKRELEPDEQLYWLSRDRFLQILDVITHHANVGITFDDGNVSDVAVVLPALLERGFRATFFVISGRLGQPGSLSRGDVHDLAKAGMTIGSHGMWHRPWRSVSNAELEEELGHAADVIASAAGSPVREVACPFGSYDRRVLGAIRRYGFSRVYTVDGCYAKRDAWMQARYTVRACDSPADIERMAGARERMIPMAIRTGKSFVKRWR
jgi:peptidoglycan/xylan/chitin deacetylase (PgdA/CDA1 family)